MRYRMILELLAKKPTSLLEMLEYLEYTDHMYSDDPHYTDLILDDLRALIYCGKVAMSHRLESDIITIFFYLTK